MKRYPLLLMLLAAACYPDQPASTSQPAAETAPAAQPSPAAPAFTPSTGPLRSGNTAHPTDHDTLHVPGGGVLYLKPSAAAAFKQAPAGTIKKGPATSTDSSSYPLLPAALQMELLQKKPPEIRGEFREATNSSAPNG